MPGTWLPRAGQKLRSQRGFHELDLPPAVFLATAIKVEELWPHSMSRANMSQILDQTYFIALHAWSRNGCQIRKRMYKQIWQPVRHAKIYRNCGKVQLLLSTCRRYDRDLSAGWQEYWQQNGQNTHTCFIYKSKSRYLQLLLTARGLLNCVHECVRELCICLITLTRWKSCLNKWLW